MILILALLAAGRYLGYRLGHTRRGMFVAAAVLAAFESMRSTGSIYRSHVVASGIIACIALTFVINFPDVMHGWKSARLARCFCIADLLSVLLAHAALKPNPSDVPSTSISAIRAMSMGLSPYKVDLDMFDAGKIKEERFRGYKYSPFLPVVYFPTILLLGDAGVLLSNTIILVCTALTIAAVCSRLLNGSGMWAAVLLLASPLVGWYTLISKSIIWWQYFQYASHFFFGTSDPVLQVCCSARAHRLRLCRRLLQWRSFCHWPCRPRAGSSRAS